MGEVGVSCHLQNWQEGRSDLINTRKLGEDICAKFCKDYKNVAEFEQRYGVNLPGDIVAMLTPPRQIKSPYLKIL